MPKVTVTCDRCGRVIEGMVFEDTTAGFYRVTRAPWNEYAHPGEVHVCDTCMWSDEDFLADYPYMRGAVPEDANAPFRSEWHDPRVAEAMKGWVKDG